MDQKIAEIKTLAKMTSVDKHTLPSTLHEETLAILYKQAEDKIYTKTVDVFWSPDLALAEMKNKLELFGEVEIYDGRVRPSSHINLSTKLPYTEKEIKEHIEACNKRMDELRKIREDKNTSAEMFKQSQYDSGRECDTRSHFTTLPTRLKAWRPVREVYASVHLNQHKVKKYEEIAGKYPDDVFVQQIWSCIRQRCSLMEEANKGRGNPMRNIHISLTFNPAETYFRASWDINRYEDGYVTHHTNITEYRLNPDGQVVQFKSAVTMNIEQKQREEKELAERRKREAEEEKARKKAEKLAELTHHTDQWGNAYSQKGKKKNTAVYDDIWDLSVPKEIRKQWNDEVAVLTMEKTYYIHYIGRRTVDTPEHSIFTCFGWKSKDDSIALFPRPYTIQTNKTKAGNYRDKDLKQVRLDDGLNLENFPKV